ncbi:MAG: nucleotidyltransferase family protein [Proteobacteria bacterium]|nr:nucleotidyltransferase family protein [Pseudomonadota bacterium]
MKAMILAAGRGERMRPRTDILPKPLLLVAGQRLIEYHLHRLAAAGFREIVINTAWLGDLLPVVLGSGERYGVSIQYSHERPTALETGGGVFKALPLLGDDPFLLVNGDVWTDVDYAGVQLPARSLAHLVLVQNPPQHPTGDFSLHGGRIDEDAMGRRWTYSGVGIYTRGFFAGCLPGKFPLLPILRRAIASQALTGQVHSGRWYDIGTPERLTQLDLELRGDRASRVE